MPLKMSQKTSFLAEFRPFLNRTIKTVTCLMHYLVLHHWSKSQTTLTIFGGARAKIPLRSSLK